jgi:hypothetical protein
MIEKIYDVFIIFIIIIKIVYYITYIYFFLCEVFNIDKDLIRNQKILNILNIIFNTSMAILLLYLFNPFYKTKEITDYVKGLLFLYAFILFIHNFEYINEKNAVNFCKKLFNIK